MSNNYRYYAEKTRRPPSSARQATSLRHQLDDLFRVVVRCERMWALEDRIERSLGR
jgi:hypothetical protein